MAHPSELNWTEFYMPDGLKASYAIDGPDIQMMVDDEDLPEGMDIQTRMQQCYGHYFNFLHFNKN